MGGAEKGHHLPSAREKGQGKSGTRKEGGRRRLRKKAKPKSAPVTTGKKKKLKRRIQKKTENLLSFL